MTEQRHTGGVASGLEWAVPKRSFPMRARNCLKPKRNARSTNTRLRA